jgi:hypothetical protein
MLSCPRPKSIAGMARSYRVAAESVGAPSGAMLSCLCAKSIAGMARSYRGCGGICRSALGRDAFPSAFEEHRGHGRRLRGGGGQGEVAQVQGGGGVLQVVDVAVVDHDIVGQRQPLRA